MRPTKHTNFGWQYPVQHFHVIELGLWICCSPFRRIVNHFIAGSLSKRVTWCIVVARFTICGCDLWHSGLRRDGSSDSLWRKKDRIHGVGALRPNIQPNNLSERRNPFVCSAATRVVGRVAVLYEACTLQGSEKVGLNRVVTIILRSKAMEVLTIIRHLERNVSLPVPAKIKRLFLCGLVLFLSAFFASATWGRSLDSTRCSGTTLLGGRAWRRQR